MSVVFRAGCVFSIIKPIFSQSTTHQATPLQPTSRQSTPPNQPPGPPLPLTPGSVADVSVFSTLDVHAPAGPSPYGHHVAIGQKYTLWLVGHQAWVMDGLVMDGLVMDELVMDGLVMDGLVVMG